MQWCWNKKDDKTPGILFQFTRSTTDTHSAFWIEKFKIFSFLWHEHRSGTAERRSATGFVGRSLQATNHLLLTFLEDGIFFKQCVNKTFTPLNIHTERKILPFWRHFSTKPQIVNANTFITQPRLLSIWCVWKSTLPLLFLPCTTGTRL